MSEASATNTNSLLAEKFSSCEAESRIQPTTKGQQAVNIGDSEELHINLTGPRLTLQGAEHTSHHSGALPGGAVNNHSAVLNWDCDVNMEAKNPFSEFSEEHLSKLDEVLSAAGVQELLQQSGPDLGLLHLEGAEPLASHVGSHHVGDGMKTGTDGASTSTRRDSMDSLPESIINAVFSDHGYCMNPDKALKIKPAVVHQSVSVGPVGLPVIVSTEPSPDLTGLPTALLASESVSDVDIPDSNTDSPYTSPRKSGRAPARNKFLDEEWITYSSPSKGRGRGKVIPVNLMSAGGFGLRASTRISDQKQRDLAEKIMLANRQALEVEKQKDSTTDTEMPPFSSPGRGSVTSGQLSSQDESDRDSEPEPTEDEESEEEVQIDSESDKDSQTSKSTTVVKGKKGKKKSKSKKGGKYEDDSDYSENDVKKKKGKKKAKGKKEEESEAEEKVGKKGKKKKLLKGKKKAKLKGKKGGKKAGSKGAKGAKKEDKEESSEEEGEVSDSSDEEESDAKVGKKKTGKSPKVNKSPKGKKKMSKKERLKKMKEAKELKKKKLLEKKKLKGKKKKLGKGTVTETDVSDTSPKKRKAAEKAKADVGKKSKLLEKKEPIKTSPRRPVAVSKVEMKKSSPISGEKKKVQITTARAAKRKENTEVSTPTKKQKMSTKDGSTADDSDDSDNDPLSDKKMDVQVSPKSAVQSKGDQNIFATLSSMGLPDAASLNTDKDNKTSANNSNLDSVTKSDKQSESGNSVKSDNKDTQSAIHSETSAKKDIDKKDDESSVRHDSLDSKNSSHHHHHHSHHRRHSTDHHRDSKDRRDRDSRDSRDREHRDSKDRDHRDRDSVSSERKDGSSHSHSRKDSHDHRERSRHESGDARRQSHDHRSSSSRSGKDRDRDRHSRKGSESKDRRDSNKDSKRRDDSDKKSESIKDHRNSDADKGKVGAVGGLKKGGVVGKTGVKVKTKKTKKAEDIAMDSSMTDLFKPDNLPAAPVKEEPVVKKEVIESEKQTKVKFMDAAGKGKEDKQHVKFPKEKMVVHTKPKQEGVEVIDLNAEVGVRKKAEPGQAGSDQAGSDSKVGLGIKVVVGEAQGNNEDDDVDIETVIDSKEESKGGDKVEADTVKDVELVKDIDGVENVVEKDKEDSGKVVEDVKDEVKDVTNVADVVKDSGEKVTDSVEEQNTVGNSEGTAVAKEIDNTAEPMEVETSGETNDEPLTEQSVDESSVVAKVTNEKSENEGVVNEDGTISVKAESVKDIEEQKVQTSEKEKVDETSENDKTENSEKVKIEDTVNKPEVRITDEAMKSPEAATTDVKEEEKVTTPKQPEPPKKEKKPMRMSDFFTDRRLKINDPKPRTPKAVKEKPAEVESPDSGRTKRNKAKALTEILKKEKMGSDDEEESSEEEKFEDDENDEDFEDPDQLYCICRQPHNHRFMICCDKCEEWFHGKCVGITKSRGAEMEKNNEDYICPQCKQKEIMERCEAISPDSSMVRFDDERPMMASHRPETPEMQEATADSTASKDSPKNKDAATATKTEPSVKSESTQVTKKEKDVKTEGADKKKVDSPKLIKKFYKDIPMVKPEAVKIKRPSGSEAQSPKSKKVPGGEVTLKSESGKSKVSSGKKVEDISEKRKRVIKMVKEESEQKDVPKHSYNKCFQCEERPPRKGSLYCSPECQAKHAKFNVPVGILKINVEKVKDKKKEKHVAVVERSTGKTLTGDKAPAESELKDWLAKNPTFEVLKAHSKPTAKPLVKSGEKHSSSTSTKTSKPETEDSSKAGKGPEPIRLNVRKGLRDALAARANRADDVMLSSSEIKSLVLSIESELFKHFKDTDSKYKAKYRSLVFNIKDHKNKGLFRKILNGRIRPSKLVRMSADELASRELAQWREMETKHTIEMIKAVETEAQKETKHLMKKTHKGEVEVEEEGEEDMSTLADEVKVEQPKVESATDLLSDLLPDTTVQHGQHLFDANCKICTGKLVPGTDATPVKSQSSVVETTDKVSSKDKEEDKDKPKEKELTKKERDLQAEEVVKEVLKAIQRAKADAQKGELESQKRSSVTVRSPDSALSSGLDKNTKFTPIGPVLWKGFIYMQDVSKFVTSAYRVTGPVANLTLPDTITICGRIGPEHVWDYLNKMKQSATRDICVVRFIPGANEEKAAYINLYSYLNSRSRCGVVENKDKHIKDFYIVPLASHSKIPSVLLPFDGPGLEENRCHMLLGVIIRNKSRYSSDSKSSHHRSSSSRHSSSKKESKKPLKSALKDTPEETEKSSTSSSPKTSSSSSTPQTADKKKSISFDPIVKEYTHYNEQDDSLAAGDDPLDLNAPYDPEKEALKEPSKDKKEKSSNAVSKMIEKIAQSKNPAEATAAMVAALATTTRFGNQRKLLLELTKKVDEQKRLLEQKRISSKLGQSPVSSSPEPSGSGSQSSATASPAPKAPQMSKDPRIRKKEQAAAAAAASALSEQSESLFDTEDMDLRDRSGVGVGPSYGAATTSTLASNAVVATTAVSTSQPSSSNKPASILSTSILQDSVSSLLSLTSEISGSADPTKKTDTKIPSQDLASNSSVITDKPVASVVTKPKGFYVDGSLAAKDAATKTENVNSDNLTSKSKEVSSDSKTNVGKVSFTIKRSDASSLKKKVADSVKDKSVDKPSKPVPDIVTQLQAEISGKPVESAASKKTEKSSIKDSESVEKDLDGAKSGADKDKSDKAGTSSSNVPNVTSLFKSLASGATTDASKKAGIQLPTALMSLFSKLPGSADEPPDISETTAIPGLFSSSDSPKEATPEPPTQEEPAIDTDTDLRAVTRQKTDNTSGVKPSKSKVKSGAKVGKEKGGSSEDQKSKSFLGFNYDSDSSDGSFEGFDDDGTRKLSPRKRKLVQKRSSNDDVVSKVDDAKTNLFGDVDDRVPTTHAGVAAGDDEDLRPVLQGDVDLRTDVTEDVDERVQDVDERLNMHPSIPGLAPGQTMPFPHPGMPMPFMPSIQPPPPGEEWSQPVIPPMSMALPAMSLPHPADWTPPMPGPPEDPLGAPEQPPLPAEPPAPKPPEPPIKKQKQMEEQMRNYEEAGTDDDGTGVLTKNMKKKKKKKDKKKKGETSHSDERLQQIVLEITKKPITSGNAGGPRGRNPRSYPIQFSMPQTMMSPQMAPTMVGPGSPMTMGNPTSSHDSQMWEAGHQGWNADAQGLNTQAQLHPQQMPPHMQPGVAPGPPGTGSHGFGMIGPGGSQPRQPPSLLDMPPLAPPPKLVQKAQEQLLAAVAALPPLSPQISNMPGANPGLINNDQAAPNSSIAASPIPPPLPQQIQPGNDDGGSHQGMMGKADRDWESSSSDSEMSNQESRDRDQHARDRDERGRDRDDRGYGHDRRRRDRHRRSDSRDRHRRSRSHSRERSREKSRDYHHRRRDSRDRDRHYGRSGRR